MRFWTQKMAASLVDYHNLFTAKVLGDLIPGGGPLLWLLWCDICGNPPTAWDTWQSQMSWEYSGKSLKGYFWSTCLWWSSWPALQVNNHLFKVLSSLPRGLTRGIFLDIWVRINTKIYSCSLLVWLLGARYEYPYPRKWLLASVWPLKWLFQNMGGRLLHCSLLVSFRIERQCRVTWK